MRCRSCIVFIENISLESIGCAKLEGMKMNQNHADGQSPRAVSAAKLEERCQERDNAILSLDSTTDRQVVESLYAEKEKLIDRHYFKYIAPELRKFNG